MKGVVSGIALHLFDAEIMARIEEMTYHYEIRTAVILLWKRVNTFRCFSLRGHIQGIFRSGSLGSAALRAGGQCRNAYDSGQENARR